MSPRTQRFLVALVTGWAFSLGIAFIVDTGSWQQPLGVALVGASVAVVTLSILQIPVVVVHVLTGKKP